MKTERIILKETILTNNCPVCYSKESIQLIFSQERKISKLMVTVKKGVTSSMHCSKCDSEIYPGIWTEDIERVFNYHKKTVQPQPASLKFTNVFYGIFLVIIVICGVAGIYMYKPALFGL